MEQQSNKKGFFATLFSPLTATLDFIQKYLKAIIFLLILLLLFAAAQKETAIKPNLMEITLKGTILDAKGVQVIHNLSKNPDYRVGKGLNRSARAYYYRVAREKKCILTNPYPSLLTNDLTVTAAYPVYDAAKKLRYIVCIDIALHDLLKIAQETSLESVFHYVSKISYTFFSAALFFVAFLLFFHGMQSVFLYGFSIEKLEIKQMFEATILITLSLAIFDLVKTIFEEEVLGHHLGKNKDIHRTMIRFLGSIIIALSIEALMLVFKFAIMSPDKIKYAVLLIAGVAVLLFGLAFYLKSTELRAKDDRE